MSAAASSLASLQLAWSRLTTSQSEGLQKSSSAALAAAILKTSPETFPTQYPRVRTRRPQRKAELCFLELVRQRRAIRPPEPARHRRRGAERAESSWLL